MGDKWDLSLVGGIPTPLKNIFVRQLDFINSQYMASDDLSESSVFTSE
jgi:hypothetical protein